MGDDWRKYFRGWGGDLEHPSSLEGGGGPGSFGFGPEDGGHASKVPHPGSDAGHFFDWSTLGQLDVEERAQSVVQVIRMALHEAGPAIYEATGEQLDALLEGLLPMLGLFLCVLAATSSVGFLAGAAIGALAFGIGAAPGAVLGGTVGIEAGLALMDFMGLVFLAQYVAESLGRAASLAKDGMLTAWHAVDHPDNPHAELDRAAKQLAGAMAVTVSGVLQGVAAYVLAKGTAAASARAIEVGVKLRSSRLGVGFAQWVEKNWQQVIDNPKLRPGALAPTERGAVPVGGGGGGGGGAASPSSAAKPVVRKSVVKEPAAKPSQPAAKPSESAAKPRESAEDRNRVERDKSTNTGHPVDVATGKVFTDQTDVQLPGMLGLRWQRVWYSTSTYAGPLGYGWHHSYDASLQLSSDGVHYHTPDGRKVSFPKLAQGSSHFDRAQKLTLLWDGDGYAVRTSDRLTYRFGVVGRRDGALGLTSIEEPSGRKVTLRYTELGRLRELIDGCGRAVKFEEDFSGRISAITTVHPERADQRIELVRYRYDAQGNLIEVLDALQHAAKYRYERHLLAQDTDRNGLSFFFEYDGKDENARCLRTWGDGGLYDHKLAYDLQRSITTVTDSIGFKTQHEHRRGLVVRTVDALGGITQFEYDGFDELVSHTDAVGHVTRYQYDARGNPTAWTQPDGLQWTARYDAQDRMLAVSQGQTQHTGLTYDAQGRVIERTDALSARTQFEYEGPDLRALVDAAGYRTSLIHDAHGNLTQVIAPNGGVTHFKYDALGRMRARTDARGNTQQLRNDLLGRVTSVQEPDGNVRSLQYDAEGNLTHFKDQHRDVAMTYRGLGRLSTRSEAGTMVVFEYDTEERLRTVLNEQGEVYRFERSPTGEVEHEIGYAGTRRSYQRDLLGRMLAVQRPSGHSSRYRYDALGRLREVEHSDGEVSRYQYRDGALTLAVNHLARVEFVRDALGRVLQEQQGPHTVHSSYDARGLRTRMHSSLGADQVITRDSLGQVQSVQAGDFSAQFKRDVLGDELERELPGGIKSRWQRDKLGRSTRHEVLSGERVLRGRSYLWDVDQRLLELRDVDHGNTRYGYDDRSRLLWARYTDGTHELRMPDAIGNLFKTEDRSDRKYGPAGELLEARARRQVIRYRYDPDGNLIEKLESSGRSWHYHWSVAGRLAAVTRPDGTQVRFDYDALGRRVRKHYRGQTTHFVWDGLVPLHEWVEGVLQPLQNPDLHAELPADSEIKRREAELQSTLAQGPPIRGSEQSPITWLFDPERFTPLGKRVGTEQLAIITDTLGVPMLMTDARGRIAWSSSVNTYGSLHHLKGSKEACPFRFQGQYEDAETGLHYNGHRYYDPDTGRYISQDPIGLAGGLALYAYCSNPLSWSDPLGLSETCGAAPGTGLGRTLGEFDAVNPGPLPDDLAGTFAGGRYRVVELQADTVLHRAGTAKQPLGQFFSSDPPGGVIQSRVDKAILPQWPGGGTSPIDTAFQVQVPAGTHVYVGPVGSQGGFYTGGTEQIVVPKPWLNSGIKVLGSTPLK